LVVMTASHYFLGWSAVSLILLVGALLPTFKLKRILFLLVMG